MAAPGSQPTETVVIPRTTDLGDDFIVRRALPSAQRRMVGPFVFFDQMGPTRFAAGRGLDVRPHPHIGLATVTYLFDGEILHRDSLGTVQAIRPGEVNWMTAGRGIAHSERSPAPLRPEGPTLSGIQLWVALPRAHEETAPDFVHYDAASLPWLEAEGAQLRLIIGSLYGKRSPVRTLSEMAYADLRLQPGARLALPTEHVERAAYILAGSITVDRDGSVFEAGRLVVFRPGADVVVQAGQVQAKLLLLAGEPLEGPRHLYWNFVSSSRERIEQAKDDWRNGRFDAVPGDPEFIPLPAEPAGPANYP